MLYKESCMKRVIQIMSIAPIAFFIIRKQKRNRGNAQKVPLDEGA